MGFLKQIKGWLGLDPDSLTPPASVGRDNPLFVYVKIPENILPIDRGKKYEDPLQAALDKEELGEVTGGGSQLAEAEPDGRLVVQFCGIDINLYDPTRGLALLRDELARLNVPQGTLLLCELDGQEWEEPVYRLAT